MCIRDRYVVAGVVSREKDKASSKAYTDGAGMFVTYSALTHITGGEEAKEPGISCYELVMAEPIAGYGLSVLRESFPTKDESVFVQNTNRYSLKNLLTIVSQLSLIHIFSLERKPAMIGPNGN